MEWYFIIKIRKKKLYPTMKHAAKPAFDSRLAC